MTSLLDNPVWGTLQGPHAELAEAKGGAARFAPDVSVFAALPDQPTPADWDDLAALVGPDGDALLLRREMVRPQGWRCSWALSGVQLVAPPGLGRVDPEARDVGPADAAEAHALVAATRPGPWRPRSLELGRFVALRAGGRLVALAGQRFHPAGHVELSAVCTDPAHRGRGLAGRLVLHLVAGIEAAGEVAFIQAAADNVGAVRLYEHLGFVHRTGFEVERVHPPG